MRKCKRCDTIDFGIWGYFALFGYSLLVGYLGYVLSQIYYKPMMIIPIVVFGVIFWLPAYFIALHERKEEAVKANGEPTHEELRDRHPQRFF